MCEHKYQVLDSETTSFYSDNKQYIQKVSVTFYCEKCLDIKYRSQVINTGQVSTKGNSEKSEIIRGVGTVTHRSYC
ncbi:hypothetical protein [Bacillus sp. 166amftsu]|uniref:hypothetical protein n=1 Tax=Bacillus sp. 166amftsu TaxID=1761753 RepID=UPI0008960063|nr:hypothetical protein [Bacillus sp. 166amftsu]SDY43177.1 hypothetical protein SAMN04488156_101366 [Bacillus sp. 166amftsu]